jgi:hypothetical protein
LLTGSATPYKARGATWQESSLCNGFETRRQEAGVKLAQIWKPMEVVVRTKVEIEYRGLGGIAH